MIEREGKEHPQGKYANGHEGQNLLIQELKKVLEFKHNVLMMMQLIMQIAQSFGGRTMSQAITDAFVKMAKNDVEELEAMQAAADLVLVYKSNHRLRAVSRSLC